MFEQTNPNSLVCNLFRELTSRFVFIHDYPNKNTNKQERERDKYHKQKCIEKVIDR